MPAFRTVLLDVDSTLCGIEGIDWLASRRGSEAATRVSALTTSAMDGRRPIAAVYGERLDMVRPTREEIDALGDQYCASVADGGAQVVRRLLAAGVRVVLISAGITDAVVKVARSLGVPADDVHAVSLRHDVTGEYAGFDEARVQGGKAAIVRELDAPRPILAVGDGMTDAELRPLVDGFAAFTGFVRRDAVVARADYELRSFADLERLVLAGESPS